MNVVNINFLILYCALAFVNVVIQTIKSLCTIKCSTFVSAAVNAIAYGLYVYVIFFTNAEGLELRGKALITAAANFSGVYIANMLFNKVFNKEVTWIVDISVPRDDRMNTFVRELWENELVFHNYGTNSDSKCCLFRVFCPTKQDSMKLKKILPKESKYNISENVKRL